MKSSTRRMWARRLLRAGWLIAPLFAIPRWFKYQFFVTKDEKWNIGGTIWFFIIIAFGCLVVDCSQYTVKINKQADAAQIAEYLKDDPCMIEMMPRWQANVKRPLKVRDLEEGKSACEQHFGDTRKMNEQKAAMKAQQEAMRAVK